MVSKRFFELKPPGWGYIAAFTILALAALVKSRTLRNPVPRQMVLIVAVFWAAIALDLLYFRYRDRRKNRHQQEDESKPR
jgi:hypothetical protein